MKNEVYAADIPGALFLGDWYPTGEALLLQQDHEARNALVRYDLGTGELTAVVTALAAEIAECAPLAVSEAKHAIDAGITLSVADALALEHACYEVVLASEDRNEGLASFAEKRPPVFKGK